MFPRLFSRASLFAAWLAAGGGSASAQAISSNTALDDPTGASGIVAIVASPSNSVRLPLPLTTNMTGTVTGLAGAGLTPFGALLGALRPSAGPGVILNLGPPIAGGVVSYPATTDTYSNLVFGTATATTGATSIRGTPSGPGGGVINMVTVTALTPATATATGATYAIASADARTDPFILAPLDSAATMTLDINLLANYPSDPSAQFLLAAQRAAYDDFSLDATTNIPSLRTLFDLSFRLSSGRGSNASGVVVDFSSPLMSAPITSSMFTEIAPGEFVLPPGDTSFDVSFTVPAGVISTNPALGPIGLELNLDQDAIAVAGVDEPSPIALVMLGAPLLLLPRLEFGKLRNRTIAPALG